jgi:hypothetical protein
MITRINDETQREEREITSNLLRSFQPPQGQELQEGQEEQEQIELNGNNNLSCPSFDPSIELLTSGNTSSSSSSSASSQMNPSNFQKNIINNRNRFSSNNSSSFLQFKIIKELERRLRHVNSSSDLYYFIEYCDYNNWYESSTLRRHIFSALRRVLLPSRGSQNRNQNQSNSSLSSFSSSDTNYLMKGKVISSLISYLRLSESFLAFFIQIKSRYHFSEIKG